MILHIAIPLVGNQTSTTTNLLIHAFLSSENKFGFWEIRQTTTSYNVHGLSFMDMFIDHIPSKTVRIYSFLGRFQISDSISLPCIIQDKMI